MELIGKKLVLYLFAIEAKGGACLRHNGNYYYSKCKWICMIVTNALASDMMIQIIFTKGYYSNHEQE
jgi:hypothetical protein